MKAYLHHLFGKLKENSVRDLQFVFNAIVISLTVMAVLFAIKPYLGDDPRLEDIKRLDGNIVTIHPDGMENLVKPASGKPVMLMIYASWCGYCKKMMPSLVQAIENHELDTVEPVFLSIDEQPRLLSKYLVHQGYDILFIPYRLEMGISPGDFTAFIQKSGSHYRGTIPYIAFFKRDGTLYSDAVGGVDIKDVIKISSQVQNY